MHARQCDAAFVLTERALLDLAHGTGYLCADLRHTRALGWQPETKRGENTHAASWLLSFGRDPTHPKLEDCGAEAGVVLRAVAVGAAKVHPELLVLELDPHLQARAQTPQRSTSPLRLKIKTRRQMGAGR